MKLRRRCKYHTDKERWNVIMRYGVTKHFANCKVVKKAVLSEEREFSSEA